MRVLLASAIFVISTMTHATALHTLKLQQKTAEEIIPILQPMIRAQDSLSGSAYTLYIRTNRETLNEIKRIIADLDKPPARLLISFKNAQRLMQPLNSASLQNVSRPYDINLSEPHESRNDNKTVRTHRRPFQITATEGKPAALYKQPPIATRIKHRQRTDNGRITEQQLLNIRTQQHPSLYITAFLNGDTVTASIKHQYDTFMHIPSDHNKLDIDITVHGELGKWLPLKLPQAALKKNRTETKLIQTLRPSEYRDTFIKFDKLD